MIVDKQLVKELLKNASTQKILFDSFILNGPDRESTTKLLNWVGEVIIEQRNYRDNLIAALKTEDNIKKEDLMNSMTKQITGGEYNYTSKMKGLDELDKHIGAIIEDLKSG